MKWLRRSQYINPDSKETNALTEILGQGEKKWSTTESMHKLGVAMYVVARCVDVISDSRTDVATANHNFSGSFRSRFNNICNAANLL